ncbi:S41 family peptidase [Patescibacteria group bacterium]
MIYFSKLRPKIIIIALILLSAGIGYRLGEDNVGASVVAKVVNKPSPKTIDVDFAIFWDVWNRLHRYYIDADEIDKQKMVFGAVSGMVNSIGDPYTIFLTPKENKDFKDDLGGAFEGIGAQLGMKDNRIIIVAPLKGSPAEASGIQAGDWIIKVDDEETHNWTITEAVTNIRGPKGTKVVLNVLHLDSPEPIDVEIIRDTINIPSVELWFKKPQDIEEISALEQTKFLKNDKTIAYLSLSRFGDRLQEEWSEAVKQISRRAEVGTIAGLVFDLRNNPGGYLDGSVYIASEFLNDGVVVSQENSDGSKQDYMVNREGNLLDVPIVVLINKGSASAAEIVAGALKDFQRASIIGETSFGKGSVQTPQDLTKGASIHITTGKWLTPKGESISKKGITPDFEVEMKNYEASGDAQLEKAIEVLLGY